MKKIKYFAFLLIFLPACALFSPRTGQDQADLKIRPESDSTEYELIVMDPGFETWVLMQPKHEHSLEYYRIRNRIYVTEWNSRFMNARRYRGLYESYIDYDPSIDYGLEFERRLYYFFRYFEESNGVRLEPGF